MQGEMEPKGAGLFVGQGRNRWAVLAGVMGAIVAAILVVAVPVSSGVAGAGALAPAATTTLKAPYKGVGQQGFQWISDGPCGAKASDPVMPSFNMTTGEFRGTANVTQTSCGKTNDSADAAILGGLASESKATFTATTGLHTIKISWTIVYTPTLTAHPTTGNLAVAESYVAVWGEVNDLTNSTSFVPSTTFVVTNVSTSGTVSHQGTDKATITLKLSLVAGHTYAVQTYVEGLVLAETSSGTSSAYANLNLATLGNHATLTSITIT